jgi:hypothetical protein
VSGVSDSSFCFRKVRSSLTRAACFSTLVAVEVAEQAADLIGEEVGEAGRGRRVRQ